MYGACPTYGYGLRDRFVQYGIKVSLCGALGPSNFYDDDDDDDDDGVSSSPVYRKRAARVM